MTPLIMLICLFLISPSSTLGQVIMYNYQQKIDHFGTLNGTFSQRYVLDQTHWSGAEKEGPIIVYFGGESSIVDYIGQVGIITMAAPRFHALVVYIEHRFYGKSMPFDSIEKAFRDARVKACLTVEQALQDYSEIILAIKGTLSATNSPVVVIGGSYAGMLAAYFRLKYPTESVGALASSAPVYYFYEVMLKKDGSCSIIDQDFKDVNHRCHDRITQSWKMMNDIALTPGGLGRLTDLFNLCMPLESVEKLNEYLVGVYSFMAQYNGRFNNKINNICDAITRSSDDELIEAIATKVWELDGGGLCVTIENSIAHTGVKLTLDAVKAWKYQLCTELVSPNGCNATGMLPAMAFDINGYSQDCHARYGVRPQINWVSTYLGSNDVGAVFEKSATNIIFSNGHRDPLSSGGVLRDISSTIKAITTTQGSHCLDLNPVKSDDPKWLKHMRKNEMHIMGQWLNGGIKMQKLSIHSALLASLLVCVLVFF